MKKLLREFLGKVLTEVSFDSNVGGGKFPAKIRDSMYGEVGRVVYFKSDDARRKAISNGTHEYVRAEDNPFAGGYDPYAPEAPTSQAPTKDDEEGEAEPFMPAELPAPSPEELAKPTPTEVGNDILSKISQELDQEAAELSDGKMSEVADGYADRDVPEGMSDAEYYAKNPSVLARRFVVPPEIRARLRAANVPERYIKFLERVINSKATVAPSDMAAISGQGTNASRFGEALTMALLALPRELRADFTKTVSAAVEEGGKKTAPTAEWVASSVGHVHAFEFSMDDKFGEGNWTFDGVAWDSALDIEGLGLARKDKGNSTDIVARVRTPNGNAMAQRLSLKKDEGTQFLSLALNTLRTTLLQFLPNRKQAQRAVRLLNILEELSQKDSSPEEKEVKENMRMSIRRSVQRDDENKPPPWPEARRRVEAQIDELTVEAARHAPAKLVESFRLLDRLADDQNDRNTQVLAGAIDELSPEEYDSIFGPKGTAGPDEKIAAECIKANGKDTQKVLACLSSKKIPGRNYSEALHNATRRIGDSYEKNKNREGQARIQEQLQTVYDLAENISNLYIESLLDSSKPEVLRGLLESMAQSFSIRTCMMGKQEVLIDGFVLNQKVLQQVFGLEDVDKLEEQLRIVTIGNQKVLVYEMKGTGEYIRIGFVRSRQKEKGRKAAVTVFVECSREFALSAAEAGANIARERGEASSLGYTYNPATGAPSQKGKVWLQVGETWTMVPDPLAAKNPTTGATARQGMVWVSTPRIQDGKITGYDWEEIERTPQFEAVMRMRADAKLSEITFEQRPMKSLLVEYLKKILNEKQQSDAAKEAKRLGLVRKPGFGLYGPPGDNQPATHTSKGGKLAPLAQQAQPQAPDTRTQSILGRDKPKSEPDTPVEETPITQLTSVLRKKERLFRNPQKKQVLQELADAMESGDPKKIQDVVTKYKLVISSTGKLKALALEGDTRTLFVPTDVDNLPDIVAKVLASVGVELRRIPQIPKQQFKPSKLLPASDNVTTEVTEENGITTVTYVDTSTDPRKVLHTLQTYDSTPESIDTRVAEWVSQNEQRIQHLQGEQREKFLTELRTLFERKIKDHNRLVKSIAELPEKDRRARILTPETGFDEAIGAIENTIKKLKIEDGGEVIELFKKLKDTPPAQVATVVKEIITAINNSSLESAKPYLLEVLTALLVLHGGDTALMPTSEQFALADVIGINNNSIFGGSEMYAIFVDYEVEVDEAEAARVSGYISVKSGAGAASSNEQKINRTRFQYPIAGSPDPENTGNRRHPRRDLTTLYGLHTSTAIFAVPTSTEDLDTHEATIKEQLERYEVEIRKYYGFSPSSPPSMDEIFDMLSSGANLVCGKDGYATASGKASKLLRKAKNKLNRRQWQLSFVTGKITEAIYNATTDIQSYTSHMYSSEGDLRIADGRRTLTAMRFEPYKSTTSRRGFLVPDQGQVARTVPVAKNEMETFGNPCEDNTANEDIYEHMVMEILYGHLPNWEMLLEWKSKKKSSNVCPPEIDG